MSIMTSQPADANELPPVVVIGPPSGWQLINFAELWHFRDLLYFLTWREVKIRYKQTVLGVAWAVLQPALMMVIFTILFSMVTDIYKGDDYPVFVLCGLIPWQFFSASISNAGNSVVGSERLVTKIYFPRLAVPFAAVGAAIIDFLVSMPLLLILFPIYGYHGLPGPSILLLPVIFLLLLISAAGIGALLAALNVAYRDVRYIIPFMVQLWMYATPTIYFDLSAPNTSSKYDWIRQLLQLNPLTGLIASFRACLLGQEIPWQMLGFSAVSAFVFFFIGCFYFRRMEDSFADVI